MWLRGSALLMMSMCLLLVSCPSPLKAQYREYFIFGKVVDTKNEPIAGVEFSIRDRATSRGYKFLTSKDGTYKFAGLPHGVYEVTVRKEGYAVKTDEWNFSTPQDRMQKVEVPTMTLVSEVLVERTRRGERARAEFKEATDRVNREDYDGAIAGLIQMLREEPTDANALYLLGICYIKKKMWPEAAEALTKITMLVPNFAGAYFQLGIIAEQENDPNKVLGYYTKASELDLENADILYNIGRVLFEQNRVPEATGYFEKALTLKSDDPEFLEMAGRCYVHAADYARAIVYLEKARNGTTDPEKVKFLGDLITKLKDLVKKAAPPLPEHNLLDMNSKFDINTLLDRE